jgi:two-component system, NtrC family, response regulator AtoC
LFSAVHVELRKSFVTQDQSAQFVLPSEGISLDEAELSFLRQAIERSGGNQTRAAELLAISRDQLRPA